MQTAPATPGQLTSDLAPILEMRGVTKRFPGVMALDGVDFSVRRGEIHSLVGQNGAGKSTLMNILSGVYPADEGHILIAGTPVTIGHPREALRLGIGTVYQELSLLPNLSVADNIFLGREPGGGFVIDERAIVAQARAVLDRLGVEHIDVNDRVDDLSLAQQQLVEIAKVLSHDPRILVLDEPTAPLVQEDTRRLFAILHGLKDRGLAIVFISHRFREIVEHCDRGTILRNGKLVQTLDLTGVTEDRLADSMIGQQIEGFYRHDTQGAVPSAEPILDVEGLSVGTRVRNVDFTLRRGEILGVTGLLGAGQNEIARALFGVVGDVKGTIRRNGRDIRIGSPADAIRHGICLLTENRKQEGLFLDLSVAENMTLPSLSSFQRGAFVDNGRERRAVHGFIAKLNIVVRSAAARVRTLSGGNQQKVILARWLMRDLDVLVLIEPTRGIDVGAKAEIYRDLSRLAGEGKGIIVVSTELPEILGVSDRTLVMFDGRLTGTFSRQGASEELLLAAIQGEGAYGL